jgi:hypothetical protein
MGNTLPRNKEPKMVSEIPVSYSGDPVFESRPKDRLSLTATVRQSPQKRPFQIIIPKRPVILLHNT